MQVPSLAELCLIKILGQIEILHHIEDKTCELFCGALSTLGCARQLLKLFRGEINFNGRINDKNPVRHFQQYA